jgi:hypothetical protein
MCAPAAAENGEIGLENKTEEKSDRTMDYQRDKMCSTSVMRYWMTTRHRELTHLLVQHPYYAISNTRRIERPPAHLNEASGQY